MVVIVVMAVVAMLGGYDGGVKEGSGVGRSVSGGFVGAEEGSGVGMQNSCNALSDGGHVWISLRRIPQHIVSGNAPSTTI